MPPPWSASSVNGKTSLNQPLELSILAVSFSYLVADSVTQPLHFALYLALCVRTMYFIGFHS